MLAESAGNPIATGLSLEGKAFVTPPGAQSIPGMAGPAPGAAAAADSGPRSRTGGASSPKSSWSAGRRRERPAQEGFRHINV